MYILVKFLRSVLMVFSFIVLCSETPLEKTPGLDKNIILADPTIFFNNGKYYLYGTGSPSDEGFTVYSSSDMKSWQGPAGTTQGYALKKGDAYGDKGFWAPQVFHHKNKFYMAFTANEKISIAISDQPLGPFKQNQIRPIDSTKQIDPFVFMDNDGKKYLYHVVVANGGNRIYVAEMADDLSSMKKETAKLCIEATEPWENKDNDKWSVTEGPTVIKQNNLYYLIYSANHFRSTHYAVGYAVSKSPLGPWEKYKGNPIISKDITGQNGSGHGDLIRGKKGKWFYVFHTHYSNEKIAPRKTALMQMEFTRDTKNGGNLVVKPGTFQYLWQK